MTRHQTEDIATETLPQRPGASRLAFVAPAIGRTSEVWMWRQAYGLIDLDLQVLASAHSNPGEFPLDGVPFHVMPNGMQAKSRILRSAQRVMKQAQIFRWALRVRPTIVLAHYGPTALSVLPAFHAAGVPVVAHFNGYDLSRAVVQNRKYAARLVANLNRLAGAVVVADYMREWLMGNGMPEQRIHLIPYGIPLEDFRPSGHIGHDPCRFLAVGRLVDKKNPLHLIRAFAHSLDQCTRSTLDIIGDGPLRSAAEALTRQLGIAERVTFHGAATRKQVRQAMADASVFVQHSAMSPEGDKEGWPVSVAEAAASGMPIVSTRHAGIPTQVQHGRSGYLVAENDWKTMGDDMARLAGDPGLRGEMGRAGRDWISQYDVNTQIAKLKRALLAATPPQ